MITGNPPNLKEYLLFSFYPKRLKNRSNTDTSSASMHKSAEGVVLLNSAFCCTVLYQSNAQFCGHANVPVNTPLLPRSHIKGNSFFIGTNLPVNLAKDLQMSRNRPDAVAAIRACDVPRPSPQHIRRFGRYTAAASAMTAVKYRKAPVKDDGDCCL